MSRQDKSQNKVEKAQAKAEKIIEEQLEREADVNESAEEYSLNDDRRVKTLSPTALVVKRFLRNRVAMVGLIPASMSMVNLIMFLMRKSLPEEEYREISAHEGSLTVAYELYLTSEKRNALVDCIAICGNEIVGLVTDPKTDKRFAKDHLQKMLRADGFSTSVFMLGDIRKFTERMDSLNAHADELRANVRHRPREGYDGYGHEDLLRHFSLNYSL